MTCRIDTIRLLKHPLAAALFLGALANGSPAEANAVVTDVGRCGDWYILSAPDGYALAQWSAGRPLSKGDAVTDDLASVGPKDTMLTSGQRVRLFVEDAGMNLAAATQMMNARCGVKPRALFHFP